MDDTKGIQKQPGQYVTYSTHESALITKLNTQTTIKRLESSYVQCRTQRRIERLCLWRLSELYRHYAIVRHHNYLSASVLLRHSRLIYRRLTWISRMLRHATTVRDRRRTVAVGAVPWIVTIMGRGIGIAVCRIGLRVHGRRRSFRENTTKVISLNNLSHGAGFHMPNLYERWLESKNVRIMKSYQFVSPVAAPHCHCQSYRMNAVLLPNRS